ncbi:hypothetical protein CDD81_5015 [Ophiocordyceps australis]|uniref:FAD synthase n=1 Tax=Ophiocordyceps australis TaxID=1399860 RepID=A0A2C5XVA0_9HYPO|nr:hypothetical protein CDD81_5015 [Ophiocordyceps australis]
MTKSSPSLVNGSAEEAASAALLKTCTSLRRQVQAFVDQGPEPEKQDAPLCTTRLRVAESLTIIQEALRRYRHQELSLSYNGGKDCLVLLILILSCLPAAMDHDDKPQCNGVNKPTATPHTTGQQESLLRPLQAIYIAPPDPFPEVEDFVALSTAHYQLSLTRYALPMRQALEAYRHDMPAVNAIFMGTRRTDPHSEFLTPFSPTDKDWPQFMRINPVLDWQYHEIWAFIRHLDIPFCSLYNQGYTSLGGVKNTRPNPALALNGDVTAYRPAYELQCENEERLGRHG